MNKNNKFQVGLGEWEDLKAQEQPVQHQPVAYTESQDFAPSAAESGPFSEQPEARE